MIFCYNTRDERLVSFNGGGFEAAINAEGYQHVIYFEAELAYETDLVTMMTKWREEAIDNWVKANPRFEMDPAIKDNLMDHLNKGVVHIDPGVINP